MPLPRFLLVTLLLFASHDIAGANAPADTLSRGERERIVREASALVRDRFAHAAALPPGTVESCLHAWRTRALATTSRREFSFAMRRFMASLGNAHTTFSDTLVRSWDSAPLPFSLAFVQGEWLVTESRTTALVPGDAIERIDGEPVDRLWNRVAPALCASSERQRRMEFTSRGFLWPREFAVTTTTGRTATLARGGAARPAAPEPVVIDRWLVADSIAYVAIPTFGAARFERTAIELIRGRYRRAAVLLIDVRGNGGGSTPRALTHLLLDGRPHVWWKEDPDRTSSSWFDQIGATFRSLGDGGESFAGRLLVLTDARCGSACEDFLMPLSWSGRATVVGDTTYGSTGQPVFRDFGNGITISVSAKRAWFPDGSQFEGVGIAPDVLVRPSREDYTSTRDRVMEAALRVARTPEPLRVRRR